MKRTATITAAVLALSAGITAQEPVAPLPPAASTPAPPPTEQAQPPTRFRSGTSMVSLNVTVSDGRKLVTGLTRDDFEVYEDGVKQQVRFFEARSVPLDVILLLDTSSSMRDRMATVHEAAREFMKLLRAGDRGAVVAFADRVTIVQALTSDKVAVETAISATAATGATALHNAIYVALKQFGRPASGEGEVRRQAIAVLSDGEDTASVVSFDDVVGLARGTGVNVYTISLQSQFAAQRALADKRYFSESQYSMRTLAKETGAQSFFPATVAELKTVYGAISNELESQYSIAYTPTNPRADGRFRRIIVRVASNPALQPRARTGYTAETLRVSATSPTHPPR